MTKSVSPAAAALSSAGRLVGRMDLRLIMANLNIADVRDQVGLSLFTDFENYSVFKPAPHHEALVGKMLDQVVAWSTALKPLRASS